MNLILRNASRLLSNQKHMRYWMTQNKDLSIRDKTNDVKPQILNAYGL